MFAVMNDSLSQSTAILSCFHCGEDCPNDEILFDERHFCCQGCLSVYQILNKAGLCTYYELNDFAGINKRESVRQDKFAYLDEPSIRQQLISFCESGQAHITFHIPLIHCSSCVYLLENLPRVSEGVVRCDINFLKKEVSVIYNERSITLRQLVETLTTLGYEPYISHSRSASQKKRPDRRLVYQLGVAGFCFGNIMLFSIPEYFSSTAATEPYLRSIFRYLNVAFSLPVFFYCAQPFLISAWKGLRSRFLNIDVPVALAIVATFVRSLTDVFISDGNGYFDAMSGIVLFMLAGRLLQQQTHRYLFFDRDYGDYFPMAATVLNADGSERSDLLTNILPGDHLRIHSQEIIPVDGVLIRGKGMIDYSFVTGESNPIVKKPGELVYSGGKQISGDIEIQTIKEVSSSKLTQLWSRELDEGHEKKIDGRSSFVHSLAKNFTLIVLAIATLSALYWWQHDASRIWPAVTSILIIACPCGLLLTATFTNGFVMRILSKNGLFVRNANVIEKIGSLNHIVFDKTGTLTSPDSMHAKFIGKPLTENERNLIASLVRPSLHAFKNPVLQLLDTVATFHVSQFKEHEGQGITGVVNQKQMRIGSATFFDMQIHSQEEGTPVFIFIDGNERGHFLLKQGLRPDVEAMFERLKNRIEFSLLTGDEPFQKNFFERIFGKKNVRFRLSPHEKMSFVELLRFKGKKVGMTGDGLNDAGALKASDAGICITDDINRFTPAGDAILFGNKLPVLDKLIQFCNSSQNTIRICFAISVLYNLTGLFFAVQGILSPLIAAILMPLSTLTIVLTTYFVSKRTAARIKLD